MDDDEHEEVIEHLDESISKLVTKGYDYFWSNNELCYDSELNVVRSDRPRVRPTTWFGFIGMHEEEKLNSQLK